MKGRQRSIEQYVPNILVFTTIFIFILILIFIVETH